MSTKDERLYAKFTLDFDEHEKIAPLSDAAFRCLIEATLWSRRRTTDGFLSRRLALARWSLEALTELCENDDEKPSLIATETGWFIHDFEEHQTTKSELASLTQARKDAGRKGGLASGRSRREAKPKRSVKQNSSKMNPESETETVLPTVTNGGELTLGNAPDRGATAPPPPPITESGKGVKASAPGQPNASGKPICHRHPDGPDHNTPCRRCAAVRSHRGSQSDSGLKVPQDATGAEQQRAERDHVAYLERRAIQRCTVPCDSDGWLSWVARGGVRFRCPHDPALLREAHDARHAELQAAQEAWQVWNTEQQQPTG